MDIQKLLKNPKIFIPIITVLIGLLIIGVVSLLPSQPEPELPPESGTPSDDGAEPAGSSNPAPAGEPEPEPQPQSTEDPWEGCKELEYDPEIDYNFVGSLNFAIEKPAAKFLEIKKDQEKRRFSLGTFKLPLETNTALGITKLWIYFFSEKLSDREDNLYGLEDSYLSRIIIKVGNKSKEINLGRSGEHAFIELTDCPLGNIYSVNYESKMEFELLLEIGCNNFQNGACLDNDGKSLYYINGADLTTQIRLFGISADEFTKDLSTSTEFKYE